jgi:hypothetical protein
MLKTLLRPLLPMRLREARARFLARRTERRFAAMSTAEVFETIYKEGQWAYGESGPLCSGLGSHDDAIVGPYVEAVREFLGSLATPPDVVDMGCGDFNVGSQLRDACAGYTACDIVPHVIERNRERFADRDVDFRVVDMVEDPLPAGDVVFIRMALQHLSNAQIAAVVPKLSQYRWAVITEHHPVEDGWVPNKDIPAGPAIRTSVDSGVMLDAPPFSLATESSREICVVRYDEGTIRTIAYQLA